MFLLLMVKVLIESIKKEPIDLWIDFIVYHDISMEYYKTLKEKKTKH